MKNIFWILVGGLLLGTIGLAAESTPTTITVTQEVIRKAVDLEPLGANNFGDSGGTKNAFGNLIVQSAFEPIFMRNLYHVIESGTENGKNWITLDGPGASNWQLYASGTYSGADMRAYRFVDADGQPLPYNVAGWAQGGKQLNTDDAAEFLPLFTSTVIAKGAEGFPVGGWLTPNIPDLYKDWLAIPKEERDEIKKSWRVYYEADQPLRMDDVVIFSRSFTWPDANDFHPRTNEKIISQWNDIVGTSRFIQTPADTPAEVQARQGVLEITPKTRVGQVWHKLFGGTGREDAIWYGTLEEGLTYRFEAWVREDDALDGTIMLGLGGNSSSSLSRGYFGKSVKETFPAPKKWMLIGYNFVAPKSGVEGIEGAIIRYEGDGKLLVDNVKLQPVYKPGDEEKPFVVNQRLFETLMETQPKSGRKGASRSWSMLSTESMDQLLHWSPASKLNLAGSIRILGNGYLSTPKALTLMEATGDSPETRMVPWLITQVTHTEEEHLQLIEYLAASYDPSIDTPESKPFAYRRTQQRGHNQPWTDSFRDIIIEFGNENWHNRQMGEWIGFGRYGSVHQGGTEYGLWAGYMMDIIKKSPYWNDTLQISLGANYHVDLRADGSVKGYGPDATIAAKAGNASVGHATYIGPRWELGESSETTIDDAGVQKTLFAYRPTTAHDFSKIQEAYERLKELGFEPSVVAYEGGPSGFGLRAKSPEEDRAGEYYGKSFAMGTAVLDSWLDAWKKGWTHQCYLNFGQGRWWNSHTSTSQGHRPSPGWLTQIMINRTVANLDLITATVENAPTLPVSVPAGHKKTKDQDTPTIYAHAFSGPNTLVVAVVNLDLNNVAPIQLKLPVQTIQSIQKHYLKGDPRDTNLDEINVTLIENKVPLKQFENGVYTDELPAGSGMIVVFNYKIKD